MRYGGFLETTSHSIKCRRAEKYPPMTVVYEHVHLVPNQKLAEELQDSVLEGILDNDSGT